MTESKRVELIDLLDAEDKQTIAAYIKKGVGCEPSHLSSVLSTWNKNKRTMFKALGKKLRLSIPVDLKKDRKSFLRELQEIYDWTVFHGKADVDYYIEKRYPTFQKKYYNHFVDNFLLYCCEAYNKHQITCTELYAISSLFIHENVVKGYLVYPGVQKQVLDYTIKPGAKTIKTIGKIIKELNYPKVQEFEEWRNLISNITTTKHIKANVVLSIHPLDFLSLSDNNADWTSCYNLLNNGMHSEATVSHMNSNCTIVAYVESKTPFLIDGFIVPNKQWRQVFYLNKNILLGGRSYPYENKDLTYKILDILKELVYNNLNWKYQYGMQEYGDIKVVEDIEELLYSKSHYSYNKHSIYMYIPEGYGYNDFYHQKDERFYCYRNYVDKSKFISMVGPLTCLHCGKECSHCQEHLLCDDCLSLYYCMHCHSVQEQELIPLSKVYGDIDTSYCHKCIEQMVFILELQCWVDEHNLNWACIKINNKEISFYTYNEWLKYSKGEKVIATRHSF